MIKEMGECIGNYFILNGEVVEVQKFNNSMVYEGESVYEVIRMKDGAPYFFSDHYQRLESSVKLQGRDQLAGFSMLKVAVRKLSSSQYFKEVNLKLVFNYNSGEANWLIYFIKSIYPGPQDYKNGVKAILFHANRENPGSKVINHNLRNEISEKLMLEKGYEALLVNSENCITEGSRSNVFFLRDKILSTAPDDYVLGGITRKHIIEICHAEGIELVMKCVNVNELNDYDAVIMTGTSPAVLPLSQVGDMKFDVSHELITFLRNSYFKKAEESRLAFLRG